VIDSRDRFDAAADAYHRCRPSYPAALFDWLLATTGLGPGAAVADVGCGTGISTRLLAERGLDVVGVDPSEPMLDRARQAGGARYQRGEAAATGLPDGAFDLVSVGQAFHWFDLPAALREFARILRPRGWCAAFWNVRHLAGPFMEEYDRLLRTHSAEYEVLAKPAATSEAIRSAPGVVDLREEEFGNGQRLDGPGLLGRANSSSYVIHGVRDRAAFDEELLRLFGRHQRDGAVEFRYRTVALAWRIRSELIPPRGPSAPGSARG
jgi:SAM-dependent methyltransferase